MPSNSTRPHPAKTPIRRLTNLKKMSKDSEEIMKVENPRETDIVIPVMGTTGVGKSSFINCVAGRVAMHVGHELRSCTSVIEHVIITHPRDISRRIILVDTPGFDDTYVEDVEILRQISLWLARSYDDGMKVAGIVYLHDICQSRMIGTSRKNLDMFRKLCGDDALKNVILGTTKWGDVDPDVGLKRASHLAESFWKDMVDLGSTIVQVHATESSAWEIINLILNHDSVNHVLIQNELVDLKMIIPQTSAGQELRFTLQDLLKQQKELNAQLKDEKRVNARDERLRQMLAENQKRMSSTTSQIRQLKGSPQRKLTGN